MDTKTCAARDRLSVKVRRKWALAHDVVGLELQRVDAEPLPPAPPGSHIELILPSTADKNLVRHYSLCNGPGDQGHFLLAVKREAASRGGSAYIHDQLGQGDILQVSNPRNAFPLAKEASRHLLFAGGIGITPLLSMAHHLNACGGAFELNYFARSIDHAAFADCIHRFSPFSRLKLGLSAKQTEEEVAAALANATGMAHVYACGPAPFIALVRELARTRLPPEQFHCEHFGANSQDVDQSNGAFQVRLSRSGGTYAVGTNETIAQALESAGHAVAISCEQGVCGTCLTRVIAGIPDHRDAYLNAAERAKGDQMLICVSRSLSPTLTLDL